MRIPYVVTALRRAATLLQFLRTQQAGGFALMVATAAALAWANSPAAALYRELLALPVGVRIGGLVAVRPLQGWIDDGLMTLFFLLVGLEIRREMREGVLASARSLAAPGIAALGGMAVPAAIYAAINWRDPAALHGWAIPVATDIAFSLAVLSLLGRRVPAELKVFLTALAIIDDLGAILVIALFYTGRLVPVALELAALAWVGLYAMGRLGVRSRWAFLLGGGALWAAVLASGVHPTLAGVLLAAVVPAGERPDGRPGMARDLELRLGPWVSFAVLPAFGLANAGLRFAQVSWTTLADPVVLGIGLGLLLGKQLGVWGSLALAVRAGLAHRPGRLGAGQLYGGALICGIGFTMSLFVANLAFPDGSRDAAVRLAVFGGSAVSALAGLAVLAGTARRA